MALLFLLNRTGVGREKASSEENAGGGLGSRLHNAAYTADLYGYTPNLLATSFRTPLSVVTSLLMYALFLFTIGYTSYFWLATPYDLTQSQDAHADGMALVPPLAAMPGAKELPPSSIAAPQLGVRMLLGPSSKRETVLLTDPSFVSMVAEQEVRCANGAYGGRVRRTLATTGPSCAFEDDGTVRVDDTTCVDYASSYASLQRSLPKDPCGTGKEWPAPRMAGTFYSDEYAYLTFAFTVNPSHADYISGRVFNAEVQVYLSYPYTSTNSLVEGSFPSTEKILFSRRIGLVVGHRVNWEVNLRVRQLVASSWFWSIPALESAALDFTVASSEVSLEAPDPTQPVNATKGVDLAKVFVRLDERDDVVELSPYSSMYSLIGEWGGYLSIIFCAGLPAYLFNSFLFRHTVKRLIKEDKITFDDKVRLQREELLESKTRAFMGGSDLQRSRRYGSSRSGSLVGRRRGAVVPGRDASEQLAGQQAAAGPAPHPAAAKPVAPLAPAAPSDLHAGCDQQRHHHHTQPDPTQACPAATGARRCTSCPNQLQEQGAAARTPPASGVPPPAAPPGGDALGVGSLTVRYAGDAFEDEDALDHNYDDVVRHCTAECTSMYHLRQVVMLVQDESRASDLLGALREHLPAWPRGGGGGQQQGAGRAPDASGGAAGAGAAAGEGQEEGELLVVVKKQEVGERGGGGSEGGLGYSGQRAGCAYRSEGGDSGASFGTGATASEGGGELGGVAAAAAAPADAGGPLLRAARVRGVAPEEVTVSVQP